MDIDLIKIGLVLAFWGMVLFAGILATSKRDESMQPYWKRACAGRLWRRRFPTAAKADLRAFLALFVKAFALDSSLRLHFTPDDRVMDIYRAINPPDWTLADRLELETYEIDFRKTYGIQLASVWNEDITLGELFALVSSKPVV